VIKHTLLSRRRTTVLENDGRQLVYRRKGGEVPGVSPRSAQYESQFFSEAVEPACQWLNSSNDYTSVEECGTQEMEVLTSQNGRA
jgi:hypothetical protein